ncbi:MAG: hypothetical protein ACE5KE_01755 [Methanosarcinales archaeon]
MLEIRYNEHLKLRIKSREVPYLLPKQIYTDADEYYYDSRTKHYIAIKKTFYNEKIRDMAISYDVYADYIEIITIHPLKKNQKENRIKTKRWVKV